MPVRTITLDDKQQAALKALLHERIDDNDNVAEYAEDDDALGRQMQELDMGTVAKQENHHLRGILKQLR